MNRLHEHALLLSGQNGLYRVETAEGELLCRAAAKIRKNGDRLLAGDFVVAEDNGDGTGFIRELHARTNALVRPPVANVGVLLLVVAVTAPKPDLFQLDKMTVICEKCGIPLAFVFTKCDLASPDELLEIYGKTPYPHFCVADKGQKGAEPLAAFLRGKTAVFCGASGVGKSSLLGALFPEANAAVGELSEKIQRGKNTTRTTTLHKWTDGTYLVDTPGFTMTDVTRYCRPERSELVGLFAEFRPYIGHCRYTHCTHVCEEGCRILQAVDEGDVSAQRHASYKRLFEEFKKQTPYQE